MNKRDKEIRKLMTEKGFDSFDDLSDRLNQFPTTGSYEDVMSELAELKMQLTHQSSKPLFTLTAKEVEELKEPIQYFNDRLNDGWLKIDGGQYLPPYSWNKAINNLLTKINQCQDENKTN